MTLKEAIQKSKTTRSKRGSLYEVRINFQLIKPRFLTEIVRANSDEDAIEKAKKQFTMRPKESIEYCSKINKNDPHLRLEPTIQVQIKKRCKSKSISPAQLDLLKELSIPNRYIKQCVWENNYVEWHLRDSLRDNYIRRSFRRIPFSTIEALFKKGLLIPIIVRDKLEDEMQIQKALGTAGDIYMYYGINYAQVKALGIKIQNIPVPSNQVI